VPETTTRLEPVQTYRQRVLRELGFTQRERSSLLARIERGELRLEDVRQAVERGCSLGLAYRIYR